MPTFGKIQQNLKPNDRVIIGNTASADLDGATGSITGVTLDDPRVTFYIVSLDKVLPNGWKTIQMIESCLDHI